MGKENFNPFSAKGVLGFRSFVWTLAAIVVVNLIIYALLRGGLINARAAYDKERTIIFYVTWFIFASMGFSIVANAFIKRWNDILGQRRMGRLLKALIRFSLLSPLLGLPVTFVTLLFYPRSFLNDVDDGGSKSGIILFFVLVLVGSVGASAFVPNSFFGLERIDFRESTKAFVSAQFYGGTNPMPSETATKPILAVATPALRYLSWMVSDFVRAKMLSVAVENDTNRLCAERLGFIKVEVQDCYFNQLRKMALQVPMVAPYFALYFETEYRKKVTELESKNFAATPLERFASSILMLSNLLELLEPGPMFIERAHLLKPPFLLHAYGSPEFALVEAGQDMQRLTIVDKILPIIDGQLDAIEGMMAGFASGLGPDEVSVKAELRDIKIRVEAVRRDPLMLGFFAH